MKRNKIRYQSKPREKKILTISGAVFLRHVDEEAIAQAKTGDLLVYPHNDALNSTRLGDYDGTGFVGYFKIDVFDGRQWCPVLPNDIFADGEQHFSKTERPADTYALCRETLEALAGKTLQRTYREHYTLEPDDD